MCYKKTVLPDKGILQRIKIIDKEIKTIYTENLNLYNNYVNINLEVIIRYLLKQ